MIYAANAKDDIYKSQVKKKILERKKWIILGVTYYGSDLKNQRIDL
jgi:hypothetical protein